MENPNQNETQIVSNNQTIQEEAQTSNPEIINNIKEENIILNDNEVQQINNNIDNNNYDNEVALKKMDIE